MLNIIIWFWILSQSLIIWLVINYFYGMIIKNNGTVPCLVHFNGIRWFDFPQHTLLLLYSIVIYSFVQIFLFINNMLLLTIDINHTILELLFLFFIFLFEQLGALLIFFADQLYLLMKRHLAEIANIWLVIVWVCVLFFLEWFKLLYFDFLVFFFNRVLDAVTGICLS